MDGDESTVRAEWRASSDSRSVGRFLKWGVGLTVGLSLAAWMFRAAVLSADFDQRYELERRYTPAYPRPPSFISVLGRSEVLTVLAIAFSTCLFLCLYITWFYRIAKRRAFMDRLLLEERRDRLRAAESDAAADDPSLSLRGLWQSTSQRLDLYHDMVSEQARRSFKHAQYAVGAGFGILVLAVTVGALQGSASSTTLGALIGAIGAALGGYVGKTFLVMQSASISQLRSYFDQPVEFFGLLAAERLANSLPSEADRSVALRAVISAAVNANARATAAQSDRQDSA
jgi:hypothetical protein